MNFYLAHITLPGDLKMRLLVADRDDKATRKRIDRNYPGAAITQLNLLTDDCNPDILMAQDVIR